MQNRVRKMRARFNAEHKRRNRLAALTIVLSILVGSFSISELTQPAITMASDPTCGFTEHAHTDACYTNSLTCGLTEDGEHTHDESCYTAALTCGQAEHAHTEDCYPEEISEPTLQPSAESVENTEKQTGVSSEDTTETPSEATEAPVADENINTPDETDAADNQNTPGATDEPAAGDTPEATATAESTAAPSADADATATPTPAPNETLSVSITAEALYCTAGNTATFTAAVSGGAEPLMLRATAYQDGETVPVSGGINYVYSVQTNAGAEAATLHFVLEVTDNNGNVQTAECEIPCPSGIGETESDWAVSAAVAHSGEWPKDLVNVAKTQLGYAASTENFIVDADGTHAYTRYGAWSGDAYADDWSTVFVSFCLRYANVPRSGFPRSGDVSAWMRTLSADGLFDDSGAYTPAEGDLLFAHVSGKLLVGIVVDASASGVTAIVGDADNAVARMTFQTDDDRIEGYGLVNAAYAASLAAEEATEEPSAEPTAELIAEATVEPTAEPTAEPTTKTTAEPTVESTTEPTAGATAAPTPTYVPAITATPAVTKAPTAEPTAEASLASATDIDAENGEEGTTVRAEAELLTDDQDKRSISLSATFTGDADAYYWQWQFSEDEGENWYDLDDGEGLSLTLPATEENLARRYRVMGIPYAAFEPVMLMSISEADESDDNTPSDEEAAGDGDDGIIVSNSVMLLSSTYSNSSLTFDVYKQRVGSDGTTLEGSAEELGTMTFSSSTASSSSGSYYYFYASDIYSSFSSGISGEMNRVAFADSTTSSTQIGFEKLRIYFSSSYASIYYYEDADSSDYSYNGSFYSDNTDYNLYLYYTSTGPYTVTFNSNGAGYANVSEEVASGSTPQNVPTTWTREGYTFRGWSATGTSSDLMTTAEVQAAAVTADTTYYAMWLSDTGWTLTFSPGTGSGISETATLSLSDGATPAGGNVTVNDTPMTLAALVTRWEGLRSDYSISGWYDGTNTYTTAQLTAMTVSADAAYTAQWDYDGVTNSTVSYSGYTLKVYAQPVDTNGNIISGMSAVRVADYTGTFSSNSSYSTYDVNASNVWSSVSSGLSGTFKYAKFVSSSSESEQFQKFRPYYSYSSNFRSTTYTYYARTYTSTGSSSYNEQLTLASTSSSNSTTSDYSLYLYYTPSFIVTYTGGAAKEYSSANADVTETLTYGGTPSSVPAAESVWSYPSHSFTGWATTADTGARMTNAQVAQQTVTSDVTYIAAWQASGWTLTFVSTDPVTGTSTTNTLTVTDGAAPTAADLAPMTPTSLSTAYEFAGWTKDGDSSGTLYQADDLAGVAVTADASYTASWQESDSAVHVIFRYGEGDYEPVDVVVESGGSLSSSQLPTWTRDAYTRKWAIGSDTTTTYTDVELLAQTFTETTTVTAVWVAKSTYTVTFVSNDSKLMETVTVSGVIEGSTLTSSQIPAWSLTGYALTWQKSDGGTTTYSTEQILTQPVTADTTYTAVWTESKDSSFSTRSVTIAIYRQAVSADGKTAYGSPVYIGSEILTYRGNSSSTTSLYAADLQSEYSSSLPGTYVNIALVSNAPQALTVTDPDVQSFYSLYGYKYTSRGNGPGASSSEWYYLYYYPTQNSYSNYINVTDSFDNYAVYLFYTPDNSYTVTYVSNISGISNQYETVKEGASPANVPNWAPAGQKLTGWYKDSDYATLLTDAQVKALPITQNTTLTAAWESDTYTYTVTFSSGGQTLASSSTYDRIEEYSYQVIHNVSYNYTLKSDDIPSDWTASDSNYTFDGWMDEDGKSYTSAELAGYVVRDDVTFTAQWQRNNPVASGVLYLPVYAQAIDRSTGTALSAMERIGEEQVTVPAEWRQDRGSLSASTVESTYQNAIDGEIAYVALRTATGGTASEFYLLQTGMSYLYVFDTESDWNSYQRWFSSEYYSATSYSSMSGARLIIFYYPTYTVTYLAGSAANAAGVEDQTEKVEPGKSPQNVPAWTSRDYSGYRVTGWQTAKGAVLTTEQVKQLEIDRDTVLTAVWTAVETVTVRFDPNGASGLSNTDVILEKNDSLAESEIPSWTWTGHKFTGWTINGDTSGAVYTSLELLTQTVTGDIIYVAQWSTAVEYTVTYNYGYGSTTETETVLSGNFPQNVPTLTRSGYTFVAWYDGTNYLSATEVKSKAVTGNVTYTAQWEEGDVSANYTGGSSSPTLTLNVYAVAVDEAGKLIEGYPVTKSSRTLTVSTSDTATTNMFSGYFSISGKEYLVALGSSKDDRLSENFVALRLYSSSSYPNYWRLGKKTTSSSTSYVGITNLPKSNTAQALAIFVYYIPTFTVTIDDGDRSGSNGTLTATVPYDESLSTSSSVTEPGWTRSGYVLHGYLCSTDNAVYSWDELYGKHIKANATFTAQWSDTATLTFDPGDAGGEPITEDITIGSSVGDVQGEHPTWTYDGYSITGWLDSTDTGSAVGTVHSWSDVSSETVTQDVTFTAVWTKDGNITFNLGTQEGTGNVEAVSPVSVVKNTAGGTMPTPMWIAHTDTQTTNALVFEGWYYDEALTQPYDPTALITADEMTLYAKWGNAVTEDTYYVYFYDYPRDDAEDYVLATVAVHAGQSVSAYDPGPVSQHADWSGKWYLDRDCTVEYDFDTMVPSEMTDYLTGENNKDLYLWPTYEEASRVTFVTYGSRIAPFSIALGESFDLDEYVPTRDGYSFVGWYRDEDLTEPAFGEVTADEPEITFYAKWTPVYVPFSVVIFTEKTDSNDFESASHLGTWYALAGTTIKVKTTGDAASGYVHEVVSVDDSGKEWPVYKNKAMTDESRAYLDDVYNSYFLFNNPGPDNIWNSVYGNTAVPWTTAPIAADGSSVVEFDYMRVRVNVTFLINNGSPTSTSDVYKGGEMDGESQGVSDTGIKWTYTSATSTSGDNTYTLYSVKLGQTIADVYPTADKITVHTGSVGSSWNLDDWKVEGTSYDQATLLQTLGQTQIRGTGRSATGRTFTATFSDDSAQLYIYAFECLSGETADITIDGVGYKVDTSYSEILYNENFLNAKVIDGCYTGTVVSVGNTQRITSVTSNSTTLYELRQDTDVSPESHTGSRSLYSLVNAYWSVYSGYNVSYSSLFRVNLVYYNRQKMDVLFNFRYTNVGETAYVQEHFQSLAYGTDLSDYRLANADGTRNAKLDGYEGYKFVGWADEDGYVYTDEDWETMILTGSAGSTKTFYAVWEPDIDILVEYYEYKGAPEPKSTEEIEETDKATMPSWDLMPTSWVWTNSDTQQESTFIWNAEMYGQYGVKETRTREDGTEYEVWVIKIYGTWEGQGVHVNYWANESDYDSSREYYGGVQDYVPTDTDEYELGTSSVPVKRSETMETNNTLGKTFVGWKLEENGVVYQAGNHVPTRWRPVMNFIAQWVGDNERVQLIYDGNGGTPTDQEHGGYFAEDATTVVWDNEDDTGNAHYTRPGYTFVGWNTQKDGSGAWYYGDDYLTLDSGTLLHDSDAAGADTLMPGYTGLGNTTACDGTGLDTAILYAQWVPQQYGLKIVKYAEVGTYPKSTVYLSGATFTLEKQTDGEWTEAQTGTTDVEGLLSVSGLDWNTLYRLTETAAPRGYNPLKNPVYFRWQYASGIPEFQLCDADGNPLSNDAYSGITFTAVMDSDGNWLLTMRVLNEPGVELPSTGGMGNRSYVAFGFLLMLAAGLMYILLLRKSRREGGGA